MVHHAQLSWYFRDQLLKDEAAEPRSEVQKIDLKGKSRQGRISDIIGEMDQLSTTDNPDDEDDLLALMDKAK